MKKDVLKEFQCAVIIFIQESCIDAGLFLGSIGIQIGSNVLKAIEYLEDITLLSPLKYSMFDEMCNSMLLFSFITVPALIKRPMCETWDGTK
jgi:hypothetical protein